MKFLLFDYRAVYLIISKNYFQSVEYEQGACLVKHFCGELESDILDNIAIEYTTNGILFVGKPAPDEPESNNQRIFCVDLVTCDILSEKKDRAGLLNIIQKILRTAIKIWNRQPFSSSERVNESKSIVFPFVYPDPRRVVIERSIGVKRLEDRGIESPILAYKYTREDPHAEDIIDPAVLKNAGNEYYQNRVRIRNKFRDNKKNQDLESENKYAMSQVNASSTVDNESFIYWSYEKQMKNLTETQRKVVESKNIDKPIRIEGAAGTGKTISMILRAYSLLKNKAEQGIPFHIIFLSHSMSTNIRNLEFFRMYENSEIFLSESSNQNIRFCTLLDLCVEKGKVPVTALLDIDAEAAKTYQLLLMDSMWEKANLGNVVQTFKPFLSESMRALVNDEEHNNVFYELLQHEFSIQIKGRTDGTIDEYRELESIPNGLPCNTPKDKDFIFYLYQQYQKELESMGSYDVDDVVLEALGKLNGPIWRRERINSGFDYIFVDEMHLFNINEQSVFHFLTKKQNSGEIPICFALDYSQAIGDRGNINADYSEKAFGKVKDKKRYHTVFRNSLEITSLCASVAASGALMFQNGFVNPYVNLQSSFTEKDEHKSDTPIIYMYLSDDDMLKSLKRHISKIIKELQCHHNNIAIISFDNKFLEDIEIDKMEKNIGIKCHKINRGETGEKGKIILASPYDINGLEFQAVILLGVDEGRVPQTAGINDISQHFVKYSAYNMLYLACSRAKYRVIMLGNQLHTISSCLKSSIEGKYLKVEDIPPRVK